jgi:Zn-dependent alcohol dehydrogenase
MLDVGALVSHHVGLEDINEALDRLAAGEALRQVIETKT